MSRHRNEDLVRVLRIDGDLSDLLPVAQARQMGPCLARIGGLVHTVTGGKVGPLQSFAASDIPDVRVGVRPGNCADRAGRLRIPKAVPSGAAVRGLPYAAVDTAYVEC